MNSTIFELLINSSIHNVQELVNRVFKSLYAHKKSRIELSQQQGGLLSVDGKGININRFSAFFMLGLLQSTG